MVDLNKYQLFDISKNKYSLNKLKSDDEIWLISMPSNINVSSLPVELELNKEFIIEKNPQESLKYSTTLENFDNEQLTHSVFLPKKSEKIYKKVRNFSKQVRIQQVINLSSNENKIDHKGRFINEEIKPRKRNHPFASDQPIVSCNYKVMKKLKKNL